MIKIFLAEERNRLNLKAKDVAEWGGVAIPTQSNYEQGKRFPDAEYLAKLADLGFDINYVLTGRRDSLMLSSQERMLIDLFRQAPDAVKRHILVGLFSDSETQLDTLANVKGNSVKVGDSNSGNVAGGDIHAG